MPAAGMISVYLNGKFTAQRTTGVQRVASRLIQALDAELSAPFGQFVLLCPVGADAPKLRWIRVRHIGFRGLPLHLWEQVWLPLAAARGLLVNLAGAAPYFGRRQICLIHDAAVFDRPEAYKPLFVGWYRLLFRRLASKARKLMTVSSFSRSRLAACLGVDASAISIVPNGCDHFDEVAADDGALERLGLVGTRFFLAVGSENPTKNIAALTQAYLALPADASRRLVIVGGSNERVFAAGGVRPKTDLFDGVVRTGPLADRELKALYRHAVALVFPSTYEGFGLPPLEAMACGCPVASARAASLPEVCGDAALYFDPSSLDDIGSTLRRLLGDDEACERLRKAGALHASAFCWAGSATKLRAEIDAARIARSAA